MSTSVDVLLYDKHQSSRESTVYKCQWLEITIPEHVTAAVLTLYKYLVKNKPWECPIGHIVPKIPTWTSYSDASEQCIGLFIKSEKVICILPFTQSLKARINANEVHINNLKYVALHLAKLLVQLLYSQNPEKYPTHPYNDAKGDNEPMIGWLNISSTASKLGQQQIRLTAKHTPCQRKIHRIMACQEHQQTCWQFLTTISSFPQTLPKPLGYPFQPYY